jgi:hypothetical protein
MERKCVRFMDMDGEVPMGFYEDHPIGPNANRGAAASRIVALSDRCLARGRGVIVA